MQLPKALLGLPTSLLLLVADQLQAQELLQQQQHPTAIKKMSPDSGEKLLREHYAFAPTAALLSSHQLRSPTLTPEEEEEEEEEEDLELLKSATNSTAFLAPFVIHYDYYHDLREQQQRRRRRRSDDDSNASENSAHENRKSILAHLRGRQFSCPPDTAACTNIGQPNYCCAAGTTCLAVDGAPASGNVGCCPEGRSCGGSVGSCAGGSTACLPGVGGGCCIAGFLCAEVGCIASTVSVITQTTTKSTTISSSPTTVISTVIITITPTESREPETTTVTRTTTATPSESEIESGTALPPVRPTSSDNTNTNTNPPTTTLTTTTTGETSASEYCPTGFYACEAQAGSGCCRTGRGCDTTSCPPPTALTTITAADGGATVVVPLPNATPTSASECAVGWFLCAAADGTDPGCCPTGYGCGAASCTLARPSVTVTAEKQAPNSAGGKVSLPGGEGWWLLWCVVMPVVAMVGLDFV